MDDSKFHDSDKAFHNMMDRAFCESDMDVLITIGINPRGLGMSIFPKEIPGDSDLTELLTGLGTAISKFILSKRDKGQKWSKTNCPTRPKEV